jgi:hypothetical protein
MREGVKAYGAWSVCQLAVSYVNILGKELSMDKLQLAGQNLGVLFNSRSSSAHIIQLNCFEMKLPNVKFSFLKT